MTNPTPTPATIPKPSALTKAPAQAHVLPAPELRHRRGDVWLVAADPGKPAVGTEIWSDRPAVIVSNNVINGNAGFAQVVYLSTSARKRTGPTHVRVPAPDGKGEAMALCEQVHTVDASRLRRKMDVLSSGFIRELDAALALSLSIGRNPDTHTAFRKWEEYLKLHGVDLAAEIQALSGETTSQRVELLKAALDLVTVERDAWRNIVLANNDLPSALRELEAATAAGID